MHTLAKEKARDFDTGAWVRSRTNEGSFGKQYYVSGDKETINVSTFPKMWKVSALEAADFSGCKGEMRSKKHEAIRTKRPGHI